MHDVDKGFSLDRVSWIHLKSQRNAFRINQKSQHNLCAVVTFFFAEAKSTQAFRLFCAFESQGGQIVQNDIDMPTEKVTAMDE